MNNGASTEKIETIPYICPDCGHVMHQLAAPDHWGCYKCKTSLEQLSIYTIDKTPTPSK